MELDGRPHRAGRRPAAADAAHARPRARARRRPPAAAPRRDHRRAAVRPRRDGVRGHARVARAAAARCSSSRTGSPRSPRLCDRATVLRDGRAVGTLVPRGRRGGADRRADARRRRATELAPAQTGTTPTGVPPRKAAVRRAALEVRSLAVGDGPRGRRRSSSRGRDPRRRRARGPGPGRAVRLPRRQRNARRAARSVVDRRTLKARHPYDAIRAGVVLVPADRLLALLPQRPIRENIASPLYNRVARWGPINAPRRARARGRTRSTRLQIDTRAAAPGAPAVRRQPAEGDDRALARGGLHRRCCASTRRAASTSARSARSTRCCASSPRRARRSCSSRASCRRSSSSATA